MTCISILTILSKEYLCLILSVLSQCLLLNEDLDKDKEKVVGAGRGDDAEEIKKYLIK